MKVKISEMKKLMENILVRRGLSKEDAETIVEDYLLGEKEGKKSHGLMAFPSIVEKAVNTGKKEIIIEKEGTSFALINGNGNFGQVVGKKAREIVCKKAKQNGIAIVGTYNMLAFLRPGAQAEMIGKEGLIGIVINNGGASAVAPTGSIDPILATNPIGLCMPCKGRPIVADFATSKRAWGEVRVAKTEGRQLPENTFMDKDGNFTIDPDKAYSVVPFGDYKGYILALVVEILTGSLVDMPMGIRPPGKDYRTSLRGALFIAIDPEKFTDFEEFTKKNSILVNQIKGSRKSSDKEILIPGERSSKVREKTEQQGYFDVDEGLYSKIKELEK